MSSRSNRDETIYQYLLVNGSKVRKDISFDLEIAPTTVYESLVRLMNLKLVYEKVKHEGKVGRPNKYFEAIE